MPILLPLFLLIIFTGTGQAQYPNWDYHQTSKSITSLRAYNDTLWISSHGFGITAFDMSSGAVTTFTKRNSGITDSDVGHIEIDAFGRKIIGFHSSNQFWWSGLNIYDGSD